MKPRYHKANGVSESIARKLLTFIILSTVGVNSIQSQEIEPDWFDDKTEITYRKLNHYKQLIEREKAYDSLVSELEEQVKTKDEAILALRKGLDSYRSELVPNLEQRINNLEQALDKQTAVTALVLEREQARIAKLKNKRIGVGIYGGYGINSNLAAVPSVGIAITYTLFRI